MPDFIGVVDLTVRLSSMNPLAHIDIQDANRRFEGAIIQACRTLHDEAISADSQAAADYMENGIVPYGASDKYFQFKRYEDIIRFARTLRSRLIAQRLPFKLCISRGDLRRGSLADKLAGLMASLPEGAAELPKKDAGEIEAVFGTRNLKQIERLRTLYRAHSASESSVALSTAIETFKGFGISIDSSIIDGADGIFRNYFPARGPSRRLMVEPFLDCTFPCDRNDVVKRMVVDSEADEGGRGRASKAASRDEDNPDDPGRIILSAGMSAMIDDILELLRRSSKAGEDNSIYYVSLLTTIVRSSHFKEIERLDAPRPIKPGSEKMLRMGWQNHPPIFHTLALDERHRSMIRKMPGIELTLAAMIDEVYAARTEEAASAALASSRQAETAADPAIPPPSPAQLAAEAEAAKARVRAVRAKEGIFGVIVRHVESTFGDAMMRRIWAVPADVLNDDRKRAMLEVMTIK